VSLFYKNTEYMNDLRFVMTEHLRFLLLYSWSFMHRSSTTHNHHASWIINLSTDIRAYLIRTCHPRRPRENQRRHFTPFVVSTDGMFGFEARAFLKRLAKLLSEEWEKPDSIVRGFINARMSIALVRATNRCIRGSRTPEQHVESLSLGRRCRTWTSEKW